MNKEHNPEATCETCPYFKRTGTENEDPYRAIGDCRRFPHWDDAYGGDQWCGEHPNFFWIRHSMTFERDIR